MKNIEYLQTLSIIFCTIVFCSGCCPNPKAFSTTQSMSVYDRVMQSGTIRCGYATFPPYCMRDPNTGKLSGIFVEIIEEAGKNMGLKIAWTEEVGWGNIMEGLESNRYDLVPCGIWPNANRGKHASFSIPLFYNAFLAYARTGDNRFNNNLAGLNTSSVTIATIDGYHVQDFAKRHFPNAHQLTHPDICDGKQVFLDIVTRKADITFDDPSLAAIFLKDNPGTIKSISNKPIEIEPNTMMFKIGEPAFKSMLDTALTELINDGFVDQVLNKYEPTPGVYLRIATPYKTNSSL